MVWRWRGCYAASLARCRQQIEEVIQADAYERRRAILLQHCDRDPPGGRVRLRVGERAAGLCELAPLALDPERRRVHIGRLASAAVLEAAPRRDAGGLEAARDHALEAVSLGAAVHSPPAQPRARRVQIVPSGSGGL